MTASPRALRFRPREEIYAESMYELARRNPEWATSGVTHVELQRLLSRRARQLHPWERFAIVKARKKLGWTMKFDNGRVTYFPIPPVPVDDDDE